MVGRVELVLLRPMGPAVACPPFLFFLQVRSAVKKDKPFFPSIEKIAVVVIPSI
jgi:hypothetical protein